MVPAAGGRTAATPAGASTVPPATRPPAGTHYTRLLHWCHQASRSNNICESYLKWNMEMQVYRCYKTSANMEVLELWHLQVPFTLAVSLQV